MKSKRILALLLAIMVLASLALTACGNNATEEEEIIEEEVVTGGETTEEETEEVEEEFTRFDEMQTINMVMMSWGDWAGVKEVAEEVNKITEELINVHINVTQMNTGVYASQVGLMLAGNEPIDLMMYGPFGATSFVTMTANNQLYDITDLIPTYAPDLAALSCRPERNYSAAGTIDGRVYGIPALRMYTTSEYLVMRRDILEACELTDQASQIDSWSDLEAVLAAVQEKMPSLPEELQVNTLVGNQGAGLPAAINGLGYGSDDFASNWAADYLGLAYLCVDEDTDEVFCNYTTDETLTYFKRMHDWSNKGYIWKDAATSTENSEMQMAAGTSFCYFSNGELGIEAEKSKTVGYPLMAIKIADYPVTNSYVSSWGWGVAYNSENPEAALAVLNLMYSNEEIENLFVWGIEGRDYELTEDGEAFRLEGLSYQSIEFFYGNQFNAYPAKGLLPLTRDLQWENNEAGEMSRYFGLNIDTEAIANEMVAVQAVIDQYVPQMGSGVVDPTTLWDDYVKDLEAAGLQAVLDHYQVAVDEFLANK